MLQDHVELGPPAIKCLNVLRHLSFKPQPSIMEVCLEILLDRFIGLRLLPPEFRIIHAWLLIPGSELVLFHIAQELPWEFNKSFQSQLPDIILVVLERNELDNVIFHFLLIDIRLQWNVVGIQLDHVSEILGAQANYDDRQW